VALNGKSFDTITFGDTGAALNGLWFNSSDDADSDNGCAAGTTYHAAILLQNGFSAETLADWTSDSANWWTPA
jgi:hypothetical protein